MNKNNTAKYASALKPLSSVFITSSFYLISSSAFAHSITLGHSQLKQYISLQDEDVLLNPAGEGVLLSLDLNDNWGVLFDYQTWQDKEQAISPVSIDLALTSLAGSLSYVQGNWYASTSISFSEDDVFYRKNQRNPDFRQEKTQVSSFSGLLAYTWYQGNWMWDISVGAQYADWSIENKIFNGQLAQAEGKPAEELSISKEDSSSINAGISAAHYWQLAQAQGILAGAMLSWNYQYSGDAHQTTDRQPPPTRSTRQQQARGRNISSNASRATSGDDNYGQLMAFLSYDINQNWSVSTDTSVEVASTNNNQSWAVAINYSF